MSNDWAPFRAGPDDLERIAGEVAAVPTIQAKLLANHPTALMDIACHGRMRTVLPAGKAARLT
jgi:hypothetical protein